MGIHNRTSAHHMNQMESMGHHSIRSEFLEVSPMQRHPKQFSKGPLKASLTSDLVNSELHEGFKDFIQHSISVERRPASQNFQPKGGGRQTLALTNCNLIPIAPVTELSCGGFRFCIQPCV
ncbi:unnamed protein product [Boreogadus saida]